jgi:hypothetical protein
MYVGKENLMSKDFKTITANAEEIPTNTLDRKINCFSVSIDATRQLYFLI